MTGINQIGTINNTTQSATTRAAIEKEYAASQKFEDMLVAAQKNQDDTELLEACRQFETYFINMMFKEMRKSVESLSPDKKSPIESTFTEMLTEEYSKSATSTGGIGLANFMYKQLQRQNNAIPAGAYIPPYNAGTPTETADEAAAADGGMAIVE